MKLEPRAAVHVVCEYSALRDEGGRWTLYSATATADGRTAEARATTRRAAIAAAVAALEGKAIREPKRKRRAVSGALFYKEGAE